MVEGVSRSAEPGVSNMTADAREIDRLLDLAEDLRSQVDASEWRRSVLQSVFLGVQPVAGGIVVYFATAIAFNSFKIGGSSSLWFFLLFAMNVGYLLFCLMLFRFIVDKFGRKVSRDLDALHEIVDMLREIEAAVATDGTMTTLERAELRIRLSRLGVGPGAQHNDGAARSTLARFAEADLSQEIRKQDTVTYSLKDIALKAK